MKTNINQVKSESFSCLVVADSFVTSWTIAHQAPPSMGFPMREYWSGLLFLPPGDLPDPEIKPASPALQANTLPLSHLGSPLAGKAVSFQKFS